VSSTVSELGIYKDFEIIWIDQFSQLPKDMDDVTLEIYHYEDAQGGSVTSLNKEPFIFTEGVDDSVHMSVSCPASGYFVETDFVIELTLVATQLEGLECPPNNFVVPGTNEKVAIVDGYTKYALSSCELAALINLQASGYTASDEGGFLVMTADVSGSDCFLEVGCGTSNSVIGLIQNDVHYGTDIQRIFDMPPKELTRIETGTYVCLNEHLTTPPYIIGERYYATYRGTCPVTSIREISQEDFTIIRNLNNRGLTFSFIS
jgi:hypothetical protein